MLIHRIWLGGEMPARYKDYGQMWLDLNPGYELHDWTEEEIWDTIWINENVLTQMRIEASQPGADQVAFYTHVADVLDYELLYRYGGWYFNTDMYPVKPLTELPVGLLDRVAMPALAMEDDIHPVNMAMYSPYEQNPFYSKVIELLPQRYFGMPGAFMNASTGVQLLEQALAEYGGQVVRYHRDVFNPIHWVEVPIGGQAPVREFGPETVAVHEWLHRTNQRAQRILP